MRLELDANMTPVFRGPVWRVAAGADLWRSRVSGSVADTSLGWLSETAACISQPKVGDVILKPSEVNGPYRDDPLTALLSPALHDAMKTPGCGGVEMPNLAGLRCPGSHRRMARDLL